MRRSLRAAAAVAPVPAKRPPAAGNGCTGLTLSYEKRQWTLHGPHTLVVGVDEAGRGPLAGPVVAAAVAVLRDDNSSDGPVEGVRDSKLITDEAEREMLFE